jgi:hypothetical protein
VIAEMRAMKALRKMVFALVITSILIGAAAITNSCARADALSPATTRVMVIRKLKPGVAREQVMAITPAEIRDTVQLYLNSEIREWYSRSDGRGVVFLLDTRDVAEARAIMKSLPLAEENVVDEEYIAAGPLLRLGLLMTPERTQ